MNEQLNKSKGFLKDKLGEYRADPPTEVWDAISARIKGRDRKGMLIVLFTAAASIALAITLGIHYFGNDSSLQKEWASEEEVVQRDEPASLKNTGENQAFPGKPEFRESNEPLLRKQKEGLEERVALVLDELDMPDEKVAVVESKELGEVLNPEPPELNEIEPEESEKREERADTLILDAGPLPEEEVLADLGGNEEKDLKWVLGAVLSPLYTFRDAEPDALEGASGQESGTVSYSAGVQVGYRASRRLALESGILFNKMGISIGAPGIKMYANTTDYETARPDFGAADLIAISNTVGNIVSFSGDIYVNNYLLNATDNKIWGPEESASAVNAEQGIRQNLEYLEVPLNLRYTLVDRGLQIQLIGGMSTNFLVNNSVTMEAADGTTEIGYLTNIRNVNYSGNAGLGFVYHIFDQLSLAIEPRFRYYLNSVNDASLPVTRPYTFGIYTGINYVF